MLNKNNIKIAIIDDGINSKYLPSSLNIIEQDYTHSIRHNDFELTHGTLCAAIIYKYFKTDVIYSYKIVDSTNQATPKNLIKALKACYNNNIDVVNLSLGTVNIFDVISIHRVVKKITPNVFIIASLSNKNTFTIPACLPEVIGVKTNFIYKNISKNINNYGDVNYLAPSIHELKLSPFNKYTTPRCNSYATAYLTAIICQNISKSSKINLNIDKYNQFNLFLDETSSISFVEYIEDVNYKKTHSLPYLMENTTKMDIYHCNLKCTKNINLYEFKLLLKKLKKKKIYPIIISNYNLTKINFGFKTDSIVNFINKKWDYYSVDLIIYLSEIICDNGSYFIIEDFNGLGKVKDCSNLYNYFIGLFE